MMSSLQEFLAQPLWLIIPLATIYIGLVGYVAYLFWHYRQKD